MYKGVSIIMDKYFPKFIKSIENLIEDEEGNIPGNKLLMLGTMVIILGSFLAPEAFAGHRSHSSHSSGSHGNHYSHSSHVSHQSHTSHANTASHSNSLYSAEGNVKYSAPTASSVPGIAVQPVAVTENTFKLPEVNQNLESPNGTPISSILPTFAVPATTTAVKIDADAVYVPSDTERI